MTNGNSQLSRTMSIRQGQMKEILQEVAHRTRDKTMISMPLIEMCERRRENYEMGNCVRAPWYELESGGGLFPKLSVNTTTIVKATALRLAFSADHACLDGEISRLLPEAYGSEPGPQRETRIYYEMEAAMGRQGGKEWLMNGVLALPGTLEVEVINQIPLKGQLMEMLGRKDAEKLYVGLSPLDTPETIVNRARVVGEMLGTVCNVLQDALELSIAKSAVDEPLDKLRGMNNKKPLSLVMVPLGRLVEDLQRRYDDAMDMLRNTLKEPQSREGLGYLILE